MTKAMRKIFVLLLCVLIALNGNFIHAYGFEDDGTNEEIEAGVENVYDTETSDEVTYTLTYMPIPDDEAEITGLIGLAKGDLVIPETIDGYRVTEIASDAFYRCNGFTGNLIIPNGVRTIGFNAFAGCTGFTGTLTLPDNLTWIDEMAFEGCYGFTGDLVIPDTVENIRQYAFKDCSGFNGTLTIPDSVNSIGYGAFEDCYGITRVVNDSAVAVNLYDLNDKIWHDENSGNTVWSVQNGVAVCSESPYAYGNLIYTVSGGKVTIVGKLFREAIENLVIPASIKGYPVTYIGNRAFDDFKNAEYCGISGSLTIPDSVTVIGADAFRECSSISGNLVIPDSVTSIGENAFYNCSGFTGSLTLSNNLTEIPSDAFCSCSGLSGSLTIPYGVTNIAPDAFAGCSSFTGSLTIPYGVANIGDYAFADCCGLTGTLVIPDSVVSIGSYVFDNCNGITTVINNSSVSLNLSDFSDGTVWYDAGSGEVITSIRNGVAVCGEAPYSTYLLTYTPISDNEAEITGFIGLAKGDLVIPEIIDGYRVTRIAPCAFYGCSGFTGSLTIPDSVTDIGYLAFSGCKGFTGTLTLSKNLTWIDEMAFAECSGFTGNLVIPDRVENIHQYAFSGCRGFDGTLTIPSGVYNIGYGAFEKCTNVTRVVNNSSVSLTLSNVNDETVWYDENSGRVITAIQNGVAISTKPDVKNGFVSINRKTYYYVDDIMQTGWQFIDSNWYYFGDDGAMVTRTTYIGGVPYKFNSDGTHTQGTWKTVSGGTRYYFAGVMATGWTTIGENIYYFNAEGYMATGIAEIDGRFYSFRDDGVFESETATAFTGYVKEGKKTYYYEDGVLVKGWKVIDGAYHYFGDDGAMLTRTTYIGGVAYKFNSDGTHTEGTWKTVSKGTRYYFAGAMATGWTTIGADTYYFNAEGYMATGNAEIDGRFYTFTDDGVFVGESAAAFTGYVKEGKYTYYYEDGVLIKGWKVIDGAYHYFGDDGAMLTRTTYIGGVPYKFNSDGTHTEGTWKTVSGGTRYYFAGVMATGWTTIGENTYYFNAEGYMATGIAEIDGRFYSFRDDGVFESETATAFTGYVKEGKKTYYYEDGVLVKGWKVIDGAYHYFGDDGAMVTRTTYIGGVAYKFNSDGTHTEGTWKTVSKGTRYYFAGAMATGWTTIGENTYYFNAEGYMATGNAEIDGRFYTFTDDGVFVGESVAAFTGYVKEGKYTYYYEDGVLVKGWKVIDGAYHYFGDDGAMLTRTTYIGGVPYKFNSDGTHTEGTWKTVSKGTRYYFAGSYVIGLQTINGNIHFFDVTTGYMVTSTNILIGDTLYMFDENGIGTIYNPDIDEEIED